MMNELLDRLSALGSHLDDERKARSSTTPPQVDTMSDEESLSERRRQPVVLAAAAVLVVALVGGLALLLEQSDVPSDSDTSSASVVSATDAASTDAPVAASSSGSLIFASPTGFEPVLFNYSVSGRGNGPVVIESVDDSGVCVTTEVGGGLSTGCYDAPIVTRGLAYDVSLDHGRYFATGVVPDQVDTVTIDGVPITIVGNVWFVELDSAAPAELRVGDSKSGTFAVLAPAALSPELDDVTTTTVVDVENGDNETSSPRWTSTGSWKTMSSTRQTIA